MERYAAAYLRRSAADEAGPGQISREAQLAAVARAVARDGWTGEVRTFEDWNRSADETKEGKRTAYLAMLAAIERDEVASVYAAALDRLYRSMRGFVRLQEVAKAHGTRVVTDREGTLGGDGSPMATAYASISAVFTTLELDTIKERNRKASAARKARGDAMGSPPYGQRVVRDEAGNVVRPIHWENDPERPLAPLIEAYRQAGSVLGAAKLLTAAKVPPPRGQEWHPTSLTLILGRAGVLPARGHRTIYSRSAILAGLLKCPVDGRILTPDTYWGRYWCSLGHRQGVAVHGPWSVLESRVLPAVKAEADRLRLPFDGIELGQDDANARDTLAERKRRLALTFADGALDEATYRAELAAIEAKVARIEAAAEVVELPPLDWSQPPGIVNGVLRALFESVQLGPDMTVAKIVWRVPEWRA